MARVLLVDDEPTILIILSAFFRAEGHEVITVGDGHQAEYLIKCESFDLIISDIRMEPVNGMQLLALAREHCPETAVIMVTAYYSAEAAKEMKAKGAFAYLKKPFDNAELLRVAREALAAKDAQGKGETSGEG